MAAKKKIKPVLWPEHRPDGKQRCGWAGNDAVYVAYHDTEWGVPVHDDKKLFEFLILEGMQAGLSWITILRKRENFKKAFDNFDAKKIALYKAPKLKKLMQDAGIIRNRLKIEASVKNAKAFLAIQKEFSSFSKYMWSFVGNKPVRSKLTSYKKAPAKTAISDTISADLKKRGCSFVGSTIIYAHMQAMGMVNDHETSCFRHRELG